MICKCTSGCIYQVVSGEFPWAVTCSEKEYITEKSWMSRRWRNSANTKRFAFRIRDIKAVHSKDIVLLKHVAAKILSCKYTLADILYHNCYWCSWLLCLLEKHNALRVPFSAFSVSFSLWQLFRNIGEFRAQNILQTIGQLTVICG